MSEPKKTLVEGLKVEEGAMRVTAKQLFIAINPDEAEHADATISRMALWQECADRLNAMLAIQPREQEGREQWREIKDALIAKMESEIMEWNNCDPELGGEADSDIDKAFERVWALAAAQHLKREQGWLIERRDRPAVEWAFVTADKFISWTPRSLEALRFARKEEAEIFAECADFSEKVFVTEHIWMEPMRVQTDFHSVNLSTGEKTRSIVGDGECRHETVGHLKREQEGRCTCVVMTPRNIYPGGRHLDDSCPVHTIQPREQEPARGERLDEARWWHARIGLNHGMKWCCERIEELERTAEPRAAQPPQELVSALKLQINADGVWLIFTASDKSSYAVNVSEWAKDSTGIRAHVLKQWTADRAALTRGAVGGTK